jgi:ribosomal protein S13
VKSSLALSLPFEIGSLTGNPFIDKQRVMQKIKLLSVGLGLLVAQLSWGFTDIDKCEIKLRMNTLSEEHWQKVDTLLNDTNWRLKVLNFLVRMSGSVRNKQDIERSRMLNNLRGYIHRGEVDTAIGLTHQLFLDVEHAYQRIHHYKAVLKNNDMDPVARSMTDSDLKEAYKKFGHRFKDYAAARSYLENQSRRQAEANVTFKSADIVLNQSSSNQLLPMLSDIMITEIQPSLSSMKDLFKSSDDIQAAHLNKYIRSQAWTAVKAWVFAGKALGSLRAVVYKIPAQYRDEISDAVGLSYDTFVRDTYLPYIEVIIASKITTHEKMIQLQEITAATNEDMVVTFARYIAGKDSWKEIKDHAEKNDESFFERMTKAETAAEKSGQLSSIYTKSPAEKTAIYATAAAVLGYLYYENPDMFGAAWAPFKAMLNWP